MADTPVNRWFFNKLSRRRPQIRQPGVAKPASLTVGQGQIVIAPTRLSAGLLVLIVLLFVLAANFQNSLIYIVCFWLMALLLVNLLHTWRNLAGLTLTTIRAEPCFAGEHTTLELELSRHGRAQKFALMIGWPGQDSVQIDLIDNETLRVRLTHPTQQRGYYTLPRLTISSTYPTGLARARAYFNPGLQAIVWPAPKAGPEQTTTHHHHPGTRDQAASPVGNGDFGGVRDYRPGDALRRIHWGKYAQTEALYSKEFIEPHSDDTWLDWDSLTIHGTEPRLSHLCSRILELHQLRTHYGLRLPQTTIEPASGEAHKARCLHALALHGHDGH